MTECEQPTQTPDDIDIDGLRERYRHEREKRLRPEGSKQYGSPQHPPKIGRIWLIVLVRCLFVGDEGLVDGAGAIGF